MSFEGVPGEGCASRLFRATYLSQSSSAAALLYFYGIASECAGGWVCPEKGKIEEAVASNLSTWDSGGQLGGMVGKWFSTTLDLGG